MYTFNGKKQKVVRELRKLIQILKGYENDAYVTIDHYQNIEVSGDIRNGYCLDWTGRPKKKKRRRRIKRQRSEQ